MNQSLPRIVGPPASRSPRRPPTTARALIDALENRLLLSATSTLTPIASFDGTNGSEPEALVEDAAGDVFGVTSYTSNGTQVGSGVLFEIPAGTSSISVLANFSNPAGTVVGESLIIDSAGNLYGSYGGNPLGTASIPDMLFELAKGATAITTLATFPAPQTPGPRTTVTAVDSAGDLFGTDGNGNPFEVVSGRIATLADVQSSGASLQDLRLGPDGNLYGTQFGPQDSSGNETYSLIEIPTNTMTLQTLATFDPATTGSTPTGVTFDSAGNLWGFCEYGGTGSDGTADQTGNGTVWELPLGSSTITAIASFTSTSGMNPSTKPVFGTSGKLYGVANTGGGNGAGSLFAISGVGSSGTPAVADVADLIAGQFYQSLGSPIAVNSVGMAPDSSGGPIVAVKNKSNGETALPPVDGPGSPPTLPPVGNGNAPPAPPVLPPVGSLNLTPTIRHELTPVDRDISNLNAQDTSLGKMEDRSYVKAIAGQNAVSALSAKLAADEEIVPQSKALLRAERGIQRKINSGEAADNRLEAAITKDEAKVTANVAAGTALYNKGEQLIASAT
jgi:hypothetical protein